MVFSRFFPPRTLRNASLTRPRSFPILCPWTTSPKYKQRTKRTVNKTVGFQEMNKLIMLPLIGLLAGCATRGDPRLSGTFISDKAATVAYLESTGHYKPEHLDLLRPMLGKLEIAYNGLSVTSTMDGYTSTGVFSIVDSGPTHVTIRSEMEHGGLIDDPVVFTHRLDFTDDGYWLMEADSEHPFKEKFRRR